MNDEVTLAQLAVEMAQLRQQVEIMSQRLDMIYGAVTRLAETKQNIQSPIVSNFANPPGGKTSEQPIPSSASTTSMPLTAAMMMDPSNMLDSLRQYAINAGLDISSETVNRLKSNLSADETEDEPTK